VGLEVGQIAVVGVILALSYAVVNKLKLRQQWWTIGLSSLAFVVALQMAAERIADLKLF
jgi:hypothetical protein